MVPQDVPDDVPRRSSRLNPSGSPSLSLGHPQPHVETTVPTPVAETENQNAHIQAQPNTILPQPRNDNNDTISDQNILNQYLPADINVPGPSSSAIPQPNNNINNINDQNILHQYLPTDFNVTGPPSLTSQFDTPSPNQSSQNSNQNLHFNNVQHRQPPTTPSMPHNYNQETNTGSNQFVTSSPFPFPTHPSQFYRQYPAPHSQQRFQQNPSNIFSSGQSPSDVYNLHQVIDGLNQTINELRSHLNNISSQLQQVKSQNSTTKAALRKQILTQQTDMSRLINELINIRSSTTAIPSPPATVDNNTILQSLTTAQDLHTKAICAQTQAINAATIDAKTNAASKPSLKSLPEFHGRNKREMRIWYSQLLGILSTRPWDGILDPTTKDIIKHHSLQPNLSLILYSELTVKLKDQALAIMSGKDHLRGNGIAFLQTLYSSYVVPLLVIELDRAIHEFSNIRRPASENIHLFASRCLEERTKLVTNNYPVPDAVLKLWFIMGLGPDFTDIQKRMNNISNLPSKWKDNNINTLIPVATAYLRNAVDLRERNKIYKDLEKSTKPTLPTPKTQPSTSPPSQEK